MMRFDVEFFGGALVGVTIGLLVGLGIGQAKGDCTGCSPGKGYEHLFDEKGNPRIMVPEGNEVTIDPRGVVWFKGKRAEDMTDEELREVVMLLLEIVRK